MKTKISIFVLAIITFIATNTMQAQGYRQQGPPPIPDSTQIVKMVNELSKELSLSDKQYSQISAMYFTHFDKVKLMRDNTANRANGQKAMENERNNFQNEVNSVLTPEQQKKYKEYLKNNEKKRGGPPPRH